MTANLPPPSKTLTLTMSTDNSTLVHKHSGNTNSINNDNNEYSNSHYLPSPISPTSIAISSGSINPFVLALDQLKSLPTTDNSTRSEPKSRTRLEQELEQIRTSSTEAQHTYHAVHSSIQRYQQLVLSTHAQVAAAKQSLIKARESLSRFQSQSSSNSSSSTSTASTASTTSTTDSSCSTTKTTNSSLPTPQTSKNSHQRPISSPDETSSNTHTRCNNEISNQPQCEKQENEDGERCESDVAPQQQVLRDKVARVHQLEQEHAELGGRLSQLLSDKAEAEETKKKLSDGLWKAKARIKDIERQLRE